MSNIAPSFEAKKPLPLPKLTSSTWKRTSGTVPFLSLQTAPAMALGVDKPLAWETATAHFQLRHPQNSFEYSMGSKCVDVSVPVRQSGQQGVTETQHKIFLSFLSVPQVLPRASMPERDYPEQPPRASEIFPANLISKLWALPDIPQGRLTSWSQEVPIDSTFKLYLKSSP